MICIWADGVRWVLTVILLVLVWRNTHWAVALAITALSVGDEVGFAALRLLVKRLKSAGAL